MNRTSEKVFQICRMLEANTEAEKMTAQRVAELLTGKRDTSGRNPNGVGEFLYYTDCANRDRFVRCYDPITSRIPVLGKLVIIFKRVIRKCVNFLLQPIVDKQNRFNEDVALALNALSCSEMTQPALKEQLEDMKTDVAVVSGDAEDLARRLEAAEAEIERLKSLLSGIIPHSDGESKTPDADDRKSAFAEEEGRRQA